MQLPQISIAIILDKSGTVPVIRIVDTSPYSSALRPWVTGIVSITQPDGLSYNGSFSAPNVYSADHINLQPALIELRLSNDGNFQKGGYLISYSATSAGYDVSTISQSFNIDYARPKGVITPNLDVFTPSLKANDTTNYAASGFNLQSIVRSWIAISTPGMSVGGDVTQFDLNINGHYYDAAYTLSLTVVITYLLAAASNVSIIDQMEVDASFSTIIPDTLNNLFLAITNNEVALGDVGGTCKDDYLQLKSNYIFAYVLFMQYIHLGTCGSSRNVLISVYNKIKSALNNNSAVPYTPTNSIIPVYNFGGFCGIGSVNIPLQITAHPQSQTKTVGQSLTLSVAASGAPTITYQWRKNGSNISGATSSSYNIGSLISGDAANYDVIVTDGLSNTLTSNMATVIVNAAISTFTAQWGWGLGDPATFIPGAEYDSFWGSAVFNSGDPVLADFRGAPAGRFLVMMEPASEPVKNVYSNSSLISGVMPDTVWRAPIVARGNRYYVTSQVVSFDPAYKTTFAHE